MCEIKIIKCQLRSREATNVQAALATRYNECTLNVFVIMNILTTHDLTLVFIIIIGD